MSRPFEPKAFEPGNQPQPRGRPMRLKSGHGKKYGQAALLALFLGIAGSGARAQNQTIGKEFQGTIFSPPLENVSLSKGSVFLPSLILEGNYDTNLLQSQGGPKLAGTFEVLEGELHYGYRHPGTDLLVSYWGGGRVYPKYSDLNSTMQDARFQLQQRVTGRIQLTFTQRWADLPGGAVLETTAGQGYTLSGGLPQGAVFLQQRFNTSESTGMLTGQLSRRTFMVLGSNYVDTTHSGKNLINMRELDVYGGIYFVPSRHQNLGVVFAQQLMKFGLGFGSSQVQSLFGSYSLSLSPTITVSLFGGPSRVHQLASLIDNSGNVLGIPSGQQTLPEKIQQGFLGGAKIERRVKHNTARVDYTQLVTGGAGFLSTVVQQTGEVTLSRSVSRRVDLSLGGTYAQNQLVGQSSLGFKNYYIQPGLQFRVTPHMRLTLRDSFGKITGLAGVAPIDREEISLRIEYTFPQIPIGK